MVEREADTVPSSSKLSSAQAWTNRVVGAVGDVILASGVVGTVISFYLQGRSWNTKRDPPRSKRIPGPSCPCSKAWTSCSTRNGCPLTN